MSTRDNDGTTSGMTPDRTYGFWGDSEEGYGVVGASGTAGSGVAGISIDGSGVLAKSQSWNGLSGESIRGTGVSGVSTSGIGVSGESSRGTGVSGISRFALASPGVGNPGIGVYGENKESLGVGVHGIGGKFGRGVVGSCDEGVGVEGVSGLGGPGVRGMSYSAGGVGVHGIGPGTGVEGISESGYGIRGSGGDIGVYAENKTVPGHVVYLATRGLGADIHGDVNIHGRLTKTGGGSFKIDHPLDPANKYLSHSFVESPDMKNIYDGVVVLDENGEAVVELPAWFEALNMSCCYQLTSVGVAGPNLYIAEEITDSHFKIAGGRPGMKVSWQVTGIRRDAWANTNRIEVEEEKPIEECGYYLHPHLYGQSEEKGIRMAQYPE